MATELKEFIRLNALAETLGVSKVVVSRWCDMELPRIKVGQQTYFHEPSVAAWLKAREQVRPTESE